MSDSGDPDGYDGRDERGVKTARLPVGLARRTVTGLEVQEVGVTYASQLLVDAERGCWLSPMAPLIQWAEAQQVTMRVWREDDGYHVIVPSGCRFEGISGLNTASLLPLAEVAVEANHAAYVPALTPAAYVAIADVPDLRGLEPLVTLARSDQDPVEENLIVLLTEQDRRSQNGPWVAKSGAWVRPAEFCRGCHVKDRTILVLYSDPRSEWRLFAGDYVVVDGDPQTWRKVA